jgi:hypothetical protein
VWHFHLIAQRAAPEELQDAPCRKNRFVRAARKGDAPAAKAGACVWNGYGEQMTTDSANPHLSDEMQPQTTD